MSKAKPIVAGYYRDQSRFTEACAAATAAGLKPEAFTPWPVHGLEARLGIPRSTLGRPVLTVILIGFALGLHLAWFTQYQDYPLNVGGKPFNAWPMFIPVTFECTILGAALSAVLGMLALNGLPMPYHPVFNVPRFALASRNRFFLCIEARDPKFRLEETRRFLETLGPREVSTVAL